LGSQKLPIIYFHLAVEIGSKMPKKFVGENSKAMAAKARKAAAKEAETSRKAQEAEDKAWEDDNKQLQKKKQKQVRLLVCNRCYLSNRLISLRTMYQCLIYPRNAAAAKLHFH
jgi:hypothetical protein